MNYTLECEQEADGRWIAEVPELPGVLSYGASRDEAIRRAEALALRTIAERIEQHESKPTAIHANTMLPGGTMNKPLILVDLDVQSGSPVFAGTRVPIQNLFDYLEEGDSLDVFLRQFPSVSRDHAVAVLEQARARLVPDAHTA